MYLCKMEITITLYCPDCQRAEIKKNGKKSFYRQNYLCKSCGRQFTGNHALCYKGCHSERNSKIPRTPVRGVGIGYIAEIEKISIGKVLSVLTRSNHKIEPKQNHYDWLEVDEFQTYAGNKNSRRRLINAYHRTTGETVAYVFGEAQLEDSQKIKKETAGVECPFRYGLFR